MDAKVGDDFGEVLKQRGQGERYRHDGSPKGWPGELIAIVEPIVATLREELVSGVPAGSAVPNFIAGVTSDNTFNARVFKHGNGYVVALNFGTLVLVQDLVNRLLCIPDAFPWVGGPSNEDKVRSFHPTRADADDYMRTMVATPLPVQPRDAIRRNTAKFLTPLAVEFILAHEFWHAVGGHLDWRRGNASTPQLDEADAMSSIAEDKRRSLERQAIEVDADGFAMYNSLRRTLALSGSTSAEGPQAWRSAITTDDQALYTSLMCGIVMVGTFFGPTESADAWAFRIHPPAGVRLGLMLHSADKALRALGRQGLLRRTLRNPDWVATFSNRTFVRLWAQMGNDSRPDELRACFGPRGQEHMKAVLESWDRIAEAVRACMPVRMSATPL